jgi:TP901 family phage tail tape measure protein
MASETTHQLKIAIGAALSGSFSSVMADSTSKISKIGTAIKDMERQSVLSVGTIDRLKSRYNSFLGSMDKQQAIIQKRAFYQSQIMGIVAMGAALAAPIKAAKEFNSHLSKFKRMYDFKEPDGHRKLGDSLLQLSLRLPVTTDNLGKLAVAGARFGVSQEDLLGYVEATGKASRVWGMEADELGEKMGNFMKVFNVKANDVPKFFDAITKMGRTSGVESKDVLGSIIRAADGLSNFKLSVPQVAALTTTIMSFGEGSEQAGTLVSGMLQKLSIAPRLGATAQKTLRDIGLSAKVIPHMLDKDPQKILDKLFTGMSKLSASQRGLALYSIFGRGPSKMVGKLIDNLSVYRENMEKASNANGIFEDDWEKVRKGTTSALTLLDNNFTLLNKQIGLVLLPTIKKFAQELATLIQPVTKFMSENKQLTSVIVHTVAGFMSLRIATFALGYASTFLFGGLNRLVIILKGLRLGMALAGAAFRSFFKIGPLAFVGIAWAVYENWKTIRGFFLKFWEEVEPYWLRFKAILDEYGVTDKIIAGWEATRDFFETIWNTAQIHWQQFKSILDEYGITEKIVAGWNIVKSLFESIWSVAEPHWNNFKLILQEYAVVDKILAAWTIVKDFFATIWNTVTPHWNAFIDKIKSLNIADKIMASWQKLKTFFTGIWDNIAPKWDNFISPLSKIWDGAKSSVSSVGSLFSFNENRPSIVSKLPPLNNTKTTPVTKNQNNSFNITVNAPRARDAEEVAKLVANKIKSYSSSFLFDPVGALP